jgi:methylglutaconyl-CoA hydratase
MIKIERPTCYLEIFEAEIGKGRLIAHLVLNRPDRANAFNAEMIEQLEELASLAAHYDELSALVIKGEGKHFSAGADLSWMKNAIELSYDENLKDAARLARLMESVVNLPCPTLALVQGSTYGGGLGLIASCDFSIATSTAKFCLSEVKVGLLPAVILPYLGRKMPLGQLNRLAMTAEVFSAKEALEYGLVQVVCAQDKLKEQWHHHLQLLLQAGPQAQKRFKILLRQTRELGFKGSDKTVDAIALARTSPEAQAGIKAFLAKEAPPFACQFQPSSESRTIDNRHEGSENPESREPHK